MRYKFIEDLKTNVNIHTSPNKGDIFKYKKEGDFEWHGLIYKVYPDVERSGFYSLDNGALFHELYQIEEICDFLDLIKFRISNAEYIHNFK